MTFYTQADSYDPYLLYSYSYYPPCYPQYGYGGGVDYYNPGNSYDSAYGYGYGSRPTNTCSTGPCSYGYRYSRRGSCYEPCAYRLGYGARRNFPSRRYRDPNPW